jgi:hypothetical protein
VLDTLKHSVRKWLQEAFQKWRIRWTGVYMREGTTSRVMAADRPYGEFYDVYSASPEYFGYNLVCCVNMWYMRHIPLHYCPLCGSPWCYLLLPSDTAITRFCVDILYTHHSVLSYYLWCATHC